MFSKYKYSAVKVGNVTSQKTQEYAARMNENVIQPTKSKMQDGTLMSDLSTGTKSWASKVATSTAKGWRDLTSTMTEDTSQSDDNNAQSLYQDMPLMTETAGRKTTNESSSLLDLDQSDTPLLHDGSSSPRTLEDNKWNDWENDGWDTKPAKEDPIVAEDEDGWEDWGNQNDLLIDFDDNKPDKGKSSTVSSATKSKPSKAASSQKVTSLQDTWDDAGGWDDAAWDEVEREVGNKPAVLKSSKAD